MPAALPSLSQLGRNGGEAGLPIKGSDITEDQKYAGPEAYTIGYTIGENNQFLGRNRVFEFQANPLDVLELHFRLSGAQNTIQRNPQTPADTITGKFSFFEAIDKVKPWPMGLRAGRHIIPRSPLPDGDVNLSCPPVPPPPPPTGTAHPPQGATRDRTGTTRLPPTCRPWDQARLDRTYSDAAKTKPGKASNEYSILRRRELLRLQPEIEVSAEGYVLEVTSM
jgi:hypothetical protein